jgi:hypothetical protein
MMFYHEYKFIFPPRTDIKTDPKVLINPDHFKGYIAQPKMNGDCMEIATNGIEFHIRHRDGSLFKKNIAMTEKLKQFMKYVEKGKWMVIVGEHMIKSKMGSDGKPFNEKFIIHDILVHDSNWLVGTTYKERIELLDSIFGKFHTLQEKWLWATDSVDIFRVKSYYDEKEFYNIYKEVIQVDMYEGFVLKKAEQKLLPAFSMSNNKMGICKIRKPTKNSKR